MEEIRMGNTRMEETSRRSPAPGGLADLPRATLDGQRRRLLEAAMPAMGGTLIWRNRKESEARDLLALSQIAPEGRMSVELLDLRQDLRALVTLKVPVPCLPEPNEEITVMGSALLGLVYPPQVLANALPGFAFLQVLSPPRIWHANVAFGAIQPLCLGAQLPPGIRVTELILMAYGALSMQAVMIDEADPAGVLNVDAARWWQHNLHRIPLSRVPFLGCEEPGARAVPGREAAGHDAAC